MRTIHLGITPEDLKGNGEIGCYVLMPGSPERSKTLFELFDKKTKVSKNPRGLDCYFGTIKVGDQDIEVAAITSGMGPASFEITCGEVLNCGGKRIERVGTSGTLQHNIGCGDFVISTGAVRDELTSCHYMPIEFPAICHPDWVFALRKAALKLNLGHRTFEAITHTKDSLWAREGGANCPNKERNLAYKEGLTKGKIANSEMELAVGLTQAQCQQKIVTVTEAMAHPEKIVKAGGICVVVNNFPKEKKEGEEEELFSTTREEQAEMEKNLCELAIEGVRQLAIMEMGIKV